MRSSKSSKPTQSIPTNAVHSVTIKKKKVSFKKEPAQVIVDLSRPRELVPSNAVVHSVTIKNKKGSSKKERGKVMIDLTREEPPKEMDAIEILFNKYANKTSKMIDPEGIEKLCTKLEVPHTDIRILMLAWKMNAARQGYFTLREWRRAFKTLRVEKISKLKKALPELEKEVRSPSNFANFYTYAFNYCLTEDKQKMIDIETTCQLLDIVLGSTFRSQVDYFVEYLKIQTDYKVINMDQWTGFYRFCNEISFPDMNNYSLELAWPLILDNFYEWMREKQA